MVVGEGRKSMSGDDACVFSRALTIGEDRGFVKKNVTPNNTFTLNIIGRTWIFEIQPN